MFHLPQIIIAPPTLRLEKRVSIKKKSPCMVIKDIAPLFTQIIC